MVLAGLILIDTQAELPLFYMPLRADDDLTFLWRASKEKTVSAHCFEP
jgi:hypothetical protein